MSSSGPEQSPRSWPRATPSTTGRSSHAGEDVAAPGVAGNARLTSTLGAILFVLLALEGYTVATGVGPHLTLHVYVGLLLIPLVVLKMGSTIYRFARYYAGSPEYRHKGPPPMTLRVLGPLVVLVTLVLFVTGVVLLFVSGNERATFDTLHRDSFIAWLIVMTVHVLGHFREAATLAPRDLYWRTRRQVKGAGPRQWLVLSAIVVGLVLAQLLIGHADHYVNQFPGPFIHRK
ncbi:MAG: hypothetical protein WA359_00385 [Acidimicrobiales bacterium]